MTQLELFPSNPLQSKEHKCHADGCSQKVHPRYFMCPQHWRLVPHAMKQAIWKHYEPGQEITKTPSREYLEAAMQARNYVRELNHPQ